MARKPEMAFSTLNTILNTAPLIIQGASKLVRMIRERDIKADDRNQDIPATLEGLEQEIQRINRRLDNGNESDLEQIKLIQELAKQNELLAVSARKTARALIVISILLIITILLTIYLVIKSLAG